MRHAGVGLALASLLLVAADSTDPPKVVSEDFEQAEVGALPAGFSAAKTGRGPGSVWEVLLDKSAPNGPKVLAQTSSDGPNPLFNVCVANEGSYTDVDVTVALKALRGRIDQGGGPVWRYRDADNYYIARMNPLENNFRVYKVVGGRRTQLGSAKVVAPAGRWHSIRIVHRGDRIDCYFNEKLYLKVTDGTFRRAGKIGLWTKADAVTSFDGLSVSAPPIAAKKAGNQPAAGLVWQSRHTTVPPQVDGVVDEVWRTARPLKVVVREAFGGGNPKTVVLRALHTDEKVYVMARWPDATKSDMRDPYVWNAAERVYRRPSKPDDQFALEFPLRGNFHVNMLPEDADYTADVWHWKAGRGNPVGWVDDKRHIISREPTPNAREYSLGGHATVYIARLMDEGTSSYVQSPRPSRFQGKVVDSYRPRKPTESLADVRGRAVHDGKFWTLEMSRKFNTGHGDDAVIDPSRATLCAIAVLDDELYWHHSVSPRILLRFSQAE